MPKILAILVTYNAECWLSTSMESIRKISHRVDLALVDNNSQDATKEILERKYSDLIKYPFYLNDNLGFGKAHNLVFSQAFTKEYDYLFLLNQDASIDAENFEQLLAVAEKANDYAIISPLHYFSDNVLDKNFTNYYATSKQDQKIAEIREVPFVNAAIWLIKAPILLEINGFHPIFPHYGEDRNLVERLYALDWKTGITPLAKGFHLRPQKELNHWLETSPYRMRINSMALILNPNKSRSWVLFRLSFRYFRIALNALWKLNFPALKEHTCHFMSLLSLYFKSLNKDLIYINNRSHH